MKLFSKRHQKALVGNALKLTIPQRLRGRIWRELSDVNHSFDTVDDTGWHGATTVLAEVEETLKRIYGTDHLLAFDEKRVRAKADLKRLVLAGWPSEVLDTVEACWHQLGTERGASFQRDMNVAFEEESCPWRLADGEYFKVDSEFLEKHVLGNAHALLRTSGFSGARTSSLMLATTLPAASPRTPFTRRARAWRASSKS